MQRSLVVLLGVVIVIAAVLLSLSYDKTDTDTRLPDYPRTIAAIADEKFTLLEAQTQEEESLGLGAIPHLPDKYGMMFSGVGQMKIWMKGMNYPIDIIWLDVEGSIIHIVHDAQPSSYPKTIFVNPEQTDARKVIELNSGEAKRLSLRFGMHISLDQAVDNTD